MRRVLLPLGQATASQLAGTAALVGGSGCITWHSLYETTGLAAASVKIHDGPASNGQELAYVTLSAGQSTRDFIALHALPFVDGLFVDVVTGAASGSITAWVDHVCEDWVEHQHKAIEVAGMEAFARLAAAGLA